MATIRNLILIICLSLTSATGFAQTSIDRIVESLENDKNVQEVMYSERRDPRTHKLLKSSRLIQFSNEKILNKLIAAFKKEREKAVSYQVSNSSNSSVYSLRFDDGNGQTAKYDLYQENGNRWMLSISIYNGNSRVRISHTTDATPVKAITRDNNSLLIIESGDGLDELMALDESDSLRPDDPSVVRIACESDGDGTSSNTVIVYSSSSTSSRSKSVSTSKSTSTSTSSSTSTSLSYR